MHLSPAELNLLLDSLNDREGVLSADWEAANRANSTAKMMELCEQLRAVRALADKLTAAKRLAA